MVHRAGWRIFSGNGDDELVPTMLGTLLSKDDSFLQLLSSPVGSTFERVGKGREFVQTDSAPEIVGAKEFMPEFFDDATVVEHLARIPGRLLDHWMGLLADLNSSRGSPVPKDLSGLSPEDLSFLKALLCDVYGDQISWKRRAAGDWKISDAFMNMDSDEDDA